MTFYIHDIHLLFIALFSLYIFTDRLIIRTVIKQSSRTTFYKNSKIPMIFITCGIIISGLFLVFETNLSFLLLIKIISAILLFYGFFNCPFFMKQQECEIRKFMYRFGVLILLVITLILGFFI